jgi:NADPH2:quinone reductase
MMQSMIIEAFGAPSVFTQKTVVKPTLLPGHVLVEVKASSINPLDIKIRNETLGAVAPPFPAILHGDVGGVVAAVGDGVHQFKVGDEIYGCAGGVGQLQGALAEYMLADADLIAIKPKNLSMTQAAALPLVSITAWLALKKKAQLREGQSVLIYGATGGVGHIAIQLAKVMNAIVTTTVSTKEKAELAKQLGADNIINYKENVINEKVAEYTNGHGFDVVFDTVGGNMLDTAFAAAKLEGHVVTIMVHSAHDLVPFFTKGLTLSAIMQPLPLLTGQGRKEYHVILNEITKLVEANKIKPLIDKKAFTFSTIAAAHDYVEQGNAIGKTVLTNDLSLSM